MKYFSAIFFSAMLFAGSFGLGGYRTFITADTPQCCKDKEPCCPGSCCPKGEHAPADTHCMIRH